MQHFFYNSPVVILVQTNKSSVFKQLLNEGAALVLGAVANVHLVRSAELHLFVDEFLNSRAETGDRYARRLEVPDADNMRVSHLLRTAQTISA